MADADAPAAAAAAAAAAPEFTPGCILELVLKRQRPAGNSPATGLISLIKESLGSVRYVEWMRPEGEQQQQQQQEGEEQQQEDAGGEGEEEGGGGDNDAAAAGEGAEADADAAAAGAEAAAGAADAAAEGGEQQQQQQQQDGEAGVEEELRYMVRFQAPEAAAAAVAAFEASEAAADGSKLVAGLPASLRVVEGEEEEAFHKRVSVCVTVICDFCLGAVGGGVAWGLAGLLQGTACMSAACLCHVCRAAWEGGVLYSVHS
jgi:hypothetical protein